MIISYIEIAGFRGFRDMARFDFPEGFVVLTGRNGVGKSTVLDAFDYALTGTISKYAVKEAKGGGLLEHVWWVGEGIAPDHHVTIGFRDEQGTEFSLTRSRHEGLTSTAKDFTTQLCIAPSPPADWMQVLVRTSLLRDETIAALSLDLPQQARFSAVREAIAGLEVKDYQKRTGDVLGAASSQRDAEARRLEQLQAELGRHLSSLTEARSLAERQPDLAEAEGIIKLLAPTLHEESEARLEDLRRHIALRKVRVTRLSELADRADVLESEQRDLGSAEAVEQLHKVRELEASALQEREAAQAQLEQAQTLQAAERASDEFASHMIALLEHGHAIGLQNGHCPLCDAARTVAQFSEARERAHARLQDRGERARLAKEAVQVAEDRLAAANSTYKQGTDVLRAHELRLANVVRESDAIRGELTDQQSLEVAVDPAVLREHALKEADAIGRLEYALYLLDTSTAHGRLSQLEAEMAGTKEAIAAQTIRVTDAERGVDRARHIHDAARTIPNQMLTEQFDTVMPLLKELYRRLRPHADWKEIDIDFGGKVRASLNLTVGAGHNPQFLFSSGQRRAAGVAFLLSILLSRPWSRLRAVLLDDPVQHIDDYRALNLVEVLSAVRRTGRQVIVSVEDAALADLLCRRLRSSETALGRRFDLENSAGGGAHIGRRLDIPPLLGKVLLEATA